jgi:glutathione synthase/RimK-type ligase-like ATP-grasp enzyme
MTRHAVIEAALQDNSHCGPAAFPIIARPVGSQAGHDLDRIANAEELAVYLERVPAEEFYVSPFIDYSGADGQFRKVRVALLDGVPYVSHMAVSSHWMVHYLNAGMYEDAAKRREEEAFMDRFDQFVQRHAAALRAIHQRSGLDYLCIDCAETRDGELLIFEIDHVMVVHSMDSLELFPFKHVHMAKLRHAFEDYLYRLRETAAMTSEA